MVGSALGGRSETAEDRMLGRPGIKDESTGGKMPDAEADGVGSVGPSPELVGNMPGISETRDDRIDGRPSRPEVAGEPSEVGIAPELRSGAVGVGVASPVPNAVVIPTTMPEVGRGKRGCTFEAEAAPLVGTTIMLGRTPVDPITAVGVGSRGPKIVESRPPRRPSD